MSSSVRLRTMNEYEKEKKVKENISCLSNICQMKKMEWTLLVGERRGIKQRYDVCACVCV